VKEKGGKTKEKGENEVTGEINGKEAKIKPKKGAIGSNLGASLSSPNSTNPVLTDGRAERRPRLSGLRRTTSGGSGWSGQCGPT
jgi:hypothetical protein